MMIVEKGEKCVNEPTVAGVGGKKGDILSLESCSAHLSLLTPLGCRKKAEASQAGASAADECITKNISSVQTSTAMFLTGSKH